MSGSNFSLREKSTWRTELKARLLNARRDQAAGRESAEGRITERLEKWLVSRPGIWLSFRGFSFEPRLAIAGDHVFSGGHAFAYPKIFPDQSLSFFRWAGTRQLAEGDWKVNPFGIQEPDAEKSDSQWRRVTADFTGEDSAEDSVVGALVPALGFDRRLFRLGRGRGFYDRFLASFDERRKQVGASPIYKIGIGFSEQLVDELPQDDHDVKLDAVLTDRELIVDYASSALCLLKGDR